MWESIDVEVEVKRGRVCGLVGTTDTGKGKYKNDGWTCRDKRVNSTRERGGEREQRAKSNSDDGVQRT